jgi:1-acyl-sn-glycerol-3-phosphate acyltransferase
LVVQQRAGIVAPGEPGALPSAGLAIPSQPQLEAPIVAVRRHVVDPVAAARNLPRGDVSAFGRSFRHWFSRTLAALVMKPWFRLEVMNRERLPAGPAVYVFNHLSWLDPMLFLATLPREPRTYFYGPKQPDLRKGKRNRFMWWTGVCVPFSPLKDDLLTSVRWAQAVFDTGGVLAISGEGAIHVHEGDLLPFQEGVAYLALRADVPIVPIAITGTSWARFRGRVLVRVGEPIQTEGRPTRQAIAHYTARAWHAVRAMVADDRDTPPPSRFERYLTDLFNDWGPGGRAAASEIRGPDPADVPIPPHRGG